MKTYLIRVDAVGYETTKSQLRATSLREAKASSLAIERFAQVNDIEIEDAKSLGFVTVNALNDPREKMDLGKVVAAS